MIASTVQSLATLKRCSFIGEPSARNHATGHAEFRSARCYLSVSALFLAGFALLRTGAQPVGKLLAGSAARSTQVSIARAMEQFGEASALPAEGRRSAVVRAAARRSFRGVVQQEALILGLQRRGDLRRDRFPLCAANQARQPRGPSCSQVVVQRPAAWLREIVPKLCDRGARGILGQFDLPMSRVSSTERVEADCLGFAVTGVVNGSFGAETHLDEIGFVGVRTVVAQLLPVFESTQPKASGSPRRCPAPHDEQHDDHDEGEEPFHSGEFPGVLRPRRQVHQPGSGVSTIASRARRDGERL